MGVSVVTNSGVSWEYVGMTLATDHENLGSDSYFTAYVWDAETEKIETVSDGSTAYGGPMATATVDATREIVNKVGAMMLADLKAALVGNHYAPVPKVGIGTVVKSLTSRGKAFGVTGEIIGEGTGSYGPFYRVKDAGTGRVVIISRDKVSAAPVATDALDKACLAFHVAMGIANESDPFGPLDITDYVKNGEKAIQKIIANAKASMVENLGYYDSADELMADFRTEFNGEGHVKAFMIAGKLV